MEQGSVNIAVGNVTVNAWFLSSQWGNGQPVDAQTLIQFSHSGLATGFVTIVCTLV